MVMRCDALQGGRSTRTGSVIIVVYVVYVQAKRPVLTPGRTPERMKRGVCFNRTSTE